MAAQDNDLNQLYVAHVEPVTEYLYRLSGDRALAEDLAQETFYRAMRQLLAGKTVNHISAWLYRIARNLYLNHVRRMRSDPEPPPDDGLFESGTAPGDTPAGGYGDYHPETEALRNERHDQILQVLLMLAETQRTGLVLRDIDGLPYEEIAEVMDLSMSAVKSVIFRARRRFGDLYAKLYLEDESGVIIHG